MDKYAELRAALESGPSLGEWSQEGIEVYADGCEFHPIAGCVRHPSCEPQEVCEANAGYIAACHPEAIRALLAERDALRDAIEAAMACGMIPKSSTQDGGASRYSRQVQVADMIRAALAQGES